MNSIMTTTETIEQAAAYLTDVHGYDPETLAGSCEGISDPETLALHLVTLVSEEDAFFIE